MEPQTPTQTPPTQTPPAPETPAPAPPAGQGAPSPAPAPAAGGGGKDMKKYLLYGGVVLVVLIIAYVLFLS